MGRGGRGGSSCGGFIVNGGLWWPESALEALGFHGCSVEGQRERAREREQCTDQFFLIIEHGFVKGSC